MNIPRPLLFAAFCALCAVGCGREPQPLTLAEKAFANEDWRAARTYYKQHLQRHPDDKQALRKRFEACARTTAKRRGALAEAHRTLFQLAVLSPGDAEVRDRLLEFCRRHGLWRGLAYYADYFAEDSGGNPRLKYYRALALEHEGQLRAAIPLYEAMIEDGTALPEIYGNLAVLLHREGRGQQAAAILDALVAAQGKAAWPYIERGRFRMETGQQAKALLDATQALSLAPDMAAGHALAARANAAMTQWDAAASHAEHALAQDPGDTQVRLTLAQAYRRRGELDSAIDLLSKTAPLLRIDDRKLLPTLAEMQIAANRSDDAERTANEYRKAYPKDYWVFEFLDARRLLARGSSMEAATKFTAVVGSGSNFEDARLHEAVAYHQADEPLKARNTLEIYIARRPLDENAHLMWEAMFRPPATLAEAEERARVVLARSASTAPVLVLAAIGLMRFTQPGDLEPVAKLLERAIRLEPASCAYETLAGFYVRNGDVSQARDVLQRAEESRLAKGKLALIRAAVAAAEGDLDRAHNVFLGDLFGDEIGRAKIVWWANLFADTWGLEAGLDVLRLAGRRARPAKQSELEVAQVALAVRLRETERASLLLSTLGLHVEENPAALRWLNEQRLALARVCLSEAPPDTKQARSLVAIVRRHKPFNGYEELARAYSWMHETPPDLQRAAKACADAIAKSRASASAIPFLANTSEAERATARGMTPGGDPR
ncbi:MAG: tetratricopeptide repeat protein [Nitrospiraceae bacterium]|nr:tetratricopeptide repeat protein [Nitrospiraceae bacterium]